MTVPTQRPGDPPHTLIEACRAGDRSALDQVLRQYAPDIEKLLARLVGPGADMQDILQNTLVAVVRAFPNYRGEASVRTWISRITVNVVRQHFRRPYQRRRPVALELVPEQATSSARGPDRVASQHQYLSRFFQHLESIGAKKRIAFVLHVFEGYPIEEVAALTGASRAATKSRIFWARRALLSRASKDPVLRELIETTAGGEPCED